MPGSKFTSVASSLRHWAEARPNDLALLFLTDGGESGRLTFAQLDDRSQRIGSRMIRAGLSGQRVLLPVVSEEAFVSALCGCLYAGVVAVPCPFRLRNRGQDRVRSIAADAGIAAVVAGSEAEIARLMAAIPGVPSFALDGWEAEPKARPAECDPQQMALLQYTSGSTSAPKGVIISHRNLFANTAMLGEAFGVHAGSRMLTWLPLFHDMGLLGNVVPALCWGIPCVVMPPLSFLQRPRRWLESIARYRITISGGPNFAYELCVRRLQGDAGDRLDLSSWELAFCGAEPVRPSTMQRFAEAFAETGFRSGALYPCYGLAEATVFVSGGGAGDGVKVLPPEAPGAREPVSCGRAPEAAPIAIVDPASNEPMADGQEGEVWVQGDHVASGYWNNPVATAATFAATSPHLPGVFLRTGDLGRRWQGDLYITGRRKNLIIHRGINLHPEDIEASIGACHPGFGPMGAAFSIEANDEEQVVAVYEVSSNALNEQASRSMIDKALDSVAQEHAVRLFDLVLVRAGTMPRTTSGKVQRDLCRSLYRSGQLARVAPAARHPSLGIHQDPYGRAR